MRILHTSDWHLNERLGGESRQPDLDLRLAEIAEYLKQGKVDVMLVSGDIFSDHYPRFKELRDIMAKLKEIFGPFLKGGGTIVWIAGNHDSEDLFDFLQHSFEMATPARPQGEVINPGGRLYLTSKPGRVPLADRQGNVVQFVLLPYPTKPRYLEHTAAQYKSNDELNRALHGEVLNRLVRMQEVINEKYSNWPSVLVAHGYVRNSEISHTGYKLSERDDIIFELSDLPTNWSYVAYGHIHKPQSLSGSTHIRYAGSLDRFDMGEAGDQKSVVLFEVGPTGQVGSIETLPLNATPLYHLGRITPATSLDELADRYKERDRAITSYELVYRPGKDDVDTYRQDLERLFPRRFKCPTIPETILQKLPEGLNKYSGSDVPAIMRQYLAERCADENERAELSNILDKLLNEVPL